VWNAHNTVFGWKRYANYAQVVYFLHSMTPSVTCLRRDLSDVSVICRVTYFQFPILLFFHIGHQAAQQRVVYSISEIGCCRKFGEYISCMPRTSRGNYLELILTVKMETRHPAEGYFVSDFLAISACNHCGVMAA